MFVTIYCKLFDVLSTCISDKCWLTDYDHQGYASLKPFKLRLSLTSSCVYIFCDNQDVMYETMTVYPLSWLYFIIFIFLTAFVFLNMMVGVVLDVMTQEAIQKEHDNQDNHHEALVAQISALQAQVARLADKIDAQHDRKD